MKHVRNLQTFKAISYLRLQDQNPVNEGSKFFRNIGEFLSDYATFKPQRQLFYGYCRVHLNVSGEVITAF
jgi:hypothetical protein